MYLCLGGMEVTVKVYVCGGADMMEEGWTSAGAHAEAQVSLPYNIMFALNQSSAPHIAIASHMLGKCVCPAPEQEDVRLTMLSASCLAL